MQRGRLTEGQAAYRPRITCGAAARVDNLPGDGGPCQSEGNRRPRPDWCMRWLGGVMAVSTLSEGQ